MAMTISGSTGVTYPDGSSQSSGQQACKAWVNFNGTGTVAIRAAYNVSSITDNGTGDYTVNFTTAFSDADYAVCGVPGSASALNAYLCGSSAAPTTTNYRLNVRLDNNTLFDTAYVNLAFFR
jgi:hypothetical protein